MLLKFAETADDCLFLKYVNPYNIFELFGFLIIHLEGHIIYYKCCSSLWTNQFCAHFPSPDLNIRRGVHTTAYLLQYTVSKVNIKQLR